MTTAAALKIAHHGNNFAQELRATNLAAQQGDKLALAKFSVKLDKLLSAENVFMKRLTSFAASCCGTAPLVGHELLSEREKHFPALLLVARVYEHLLCAQQIKLTKEFSLCRVRALFEDHRNLGKRLQRRQADLQAALWKQLPQETQRVTSKRTWDFGITVTARSLWEVFAWKESNGGEWAQAGTTQGQHERTLNCSDWLEAIAKKILGLPGVVDRRDGSLNVDKIPDGPALLKLAMFLAPVYVRARRDFFVTQLTQQLRYRTDQITRFSRVDGVEMTEGNAILNLVLGIPEVLFAEVCRYRAAQRAAA